MRRLLVAVFVGGLFMIHELGTTFWLPDAFGSTYLWLIAWTFGWCAVRKYRELYPVFGVDETLSPARRRSADRR